MFWKTAQINSMRRKFQVSYRHDEDEQWHVPKHRHNQRELFKQTAFFERIAYAFLEVVLSKNGEIVSKLLCQQSSSKKRNTDHRSVVFR